MTRRFKFITSLVISAVLMIASITMMVVSGVVASNKYKGVKYSHDINISEIKTDSASLSGVVYHYVTIDGGIKNCTDKDMANMDVIIYFEGVNNSTGEEGVQYEASFILEDFKAGKVFDIDKKTIKVGNKSGFVPESIKKIEISSMEQGSRTKAVYIKQDDSMVVLFGLGLAVLLASSVIMIRAIVSNAKKNVALQSGNK